MWAQFVYLKHLWGFEHLNVGKEYARADFRWGLADPTVVSLEILTVLIVAPMCCYVVKQLINDDPARHYWIIVLSTAELYGG
jgi:EXPERA (EXPanded EBP superfamily)